MDSATHCTTKQEENVSRAQSQDMLDTSSASSLSFFADNSDGQNNGEQENEEEKSGGSSPSAPMNEALKSEKAFIEFVMSLPPKEPPEKHHRSIDSVSIPKCRTPAAVSNTTKVGLDHLDNLCKLMEQLSELRENNNKLQRRVQYLEDLKSLHDMHKETEEERLYRSEDAIVKDPHPYELKKSATESCCPKKEEEVQHNRNYSKYHSRRGRPQSADGQRRERSKSVGHDDSAEDRKSKRIFPRWSKVKEAFGWESERKDSVKIKGSGDVGSLRIPRRCSDDSHQSSNQMNSPTWSQDFPSLHSSLEDVNELLDTDKWKRTSVISDKSVLRVETPKEVLRRQKSTPSPGSERQMSHRNSADVKGKSSTIERDAYISPDYKDDGKRGKGPWGRVKTIIERRRDSLKRRSLRRDHTCSECDSTTCNKDYTELLEKSAVKHSTQADSSRNKNMAPEPLVIDQDIDYGDTRTPSSSPTFHRKSRWTRVKKALTGKKEDEKDPSLSTPASPSSGQDGHFPFDVIEEMSQDSNDREIKRAGSDSHMHQMVLSEPTCDLMLQLQRNLSEDFHKKIMEWERIRSSGNVSCSPHWDRKPSISSRTRKKSERDDKNIKPKFKDLTWLEKELQKIEKEKQRLSKEKQKYEERALRLEKLKETVLNANNSNKREVLVKTSAGEFRFEGISDAFTKKLYEWETKRGVGPELSTIALLDSSLLTVQKSMNPKSGPLQRILSRSESSIVDLGQPSRNSSNSLPSLKISDTIDSERVIQPSKVNSEPDLSTLAALTNGSNVSLSNLSGHVEGLIDNETTELGTVSKELSEEDELNPKRNDSETYYGLLEENVILLEQLKDKEEICSKLERELQLLDQKVDVMNKHHTQETELYKEKLWEMHKPGATPRDVQCCLRTMSQLRKRIEVLEKCTEKLRNDRESVEDSFRFHSQEQEDMTLDLLQKMGELQAAGSSATECEAKKHISKCLNSSVVEKLQDLSALLIKQTQELQETLSAKSRQICQLRWELLHKDLSTVKLETELHTHTAHRKRSKYAHIRSHSSEDAPSAVPTKQELDGGKSTVIPETYYNSTGPEGEFQASQLTNTVQELNRELLKLANNAADFGNSGDSETHQIKSRSEETRTKTKADWQSMRDENSKKITVRRNSAENCIMSEKIEPTPWQQNASSSLDSDDSSDDAYTKITFHPSAKGKYATSPPTERLLMSSGEHPPRTYLQRRKKTQKLTRGNSSPSRKRSNTFHNKRDFEKPILLEHMPQKCHSFRCPRENNFSNKDVKNKLDAINIQSILGEVRYQELLHRTAELHCRGRISNPSKNLATEDSGSKTENKWLRDSASDTTIPFLGKEQRREEMGRHKSRINQPVRSMSDKHRKESAAERREHFLKRKRRQLTSPDLFSGLNDNTENKFHDRQSFDQKISKSNSLKEAKRVYQNTVPPNNHIPSPSTSTVTIQLPKRKVKKTNIKPPPDSEDKIEESFTIVIPKKRSLSSEQEFEHSLTDSFKIKQAEKNKQLSSYERNRNLSVSDSSHSLTDSQENKINMTENVDKNRTAALSNTCVETTVVRCESPEIIFKPNQQDKNFSTLVVPCEKEKNPLIAPKPLLYTHVNHSDDLKSTVQNYSSHISETNYVKSPSAPHLDWKRACARKVSPGSATNVKSLIDKYNRVAENQLNRSANSSNVSSPASYRKISSPIFKSHQEHTQLSHSFSTPTTPNIMSASTFYNPLVFQPKNLDLFSKSPPASPMSIARSEAIKKAKEQFIASQTASNLPQIRAYNQNLYLHKQSFSENNVPRFLAKSETKNSQKVEDDRVSNTSMDSMSYVMFRTGETCQESRLLKRSIDHSKVLDSNTLDRNKLKTSKSLSNSSIFKSVLNSDFKIPSTLMKLKRSKKKKDMGTVSQLCRQSLLLTPEDSAKISIQPSHKSCPSSPQLKPKTETKANWFQRNIFRHK